MQEQTKGAPDQGAPTTKLFSVPSRQCLHCDASLVHGECVNIKCPYGVDFKETAHSLKVMALRLQAQSLTDKNGKRKALREKVTQSLLRLAQSAHVRSLAGYGE